MLPPTPRTESLLSKLLKAIIIMVCLLAIPLFIMPLLNQSPSIVMATWQKITLLKEPLPAENSLPSPLPERHLVDTWGGARSEGRSHEGIDIFAPRGTPIQATTKGMGELPENLQPLFAQLRELPPQWHGLLGGVIGLGDACYGEDFCAGAEMMRELYEELGVVELQEILRLDASETVSPEQDAEPWLAEFAENLKAAVVQ